MRKPIDIKKPDEGYIEWTCKKCGLLRSNKENHRHGMPMTRREVPNAEKAEAQEQGEQAQR